MRSVAQLVEHWTSGGESPASSRSDAQSTIYIGYIGDRKGLQLVASWSAEWDQLCPAMIGMINCDLQIIPIHRIARSDGRGQGLHSKSA